METQVRAFLTSSQTQKRYAKNTLLGYENDLKHFIKYLENELGVPAEIEDLTSERVTNFLKTERQMGRKPSTIRRRLAAINRFCHFAGKNGHTLRHHAVIGAQTSQTSVKPNKAEVCLSNKEIKALTQIIEADVRPQARRDRAILAILLETGLSVSKLTALDLSDFAASQNCLLQSNVARKPRQIPLGKTGKILQTYLLEGRPELNPVSQEKALFVSQLGMRVSRQGVWQICQRWGKRAQLANSLSPRRLRYSAVQRMWKSGHSQEEIQTALNHRSLVTTQALLDRIQTQTLT